MVQRIVIPYAPRPQFLPYHNTDKRWSCIVAHRRAGKTVACVNRLIKSALTKPESPRVAYLAPLYVQAKDVAWAYVKQFSSPIPGVQFNESELRADYPNGGRLRLYGAENYDRLRGIYLDDVVLDEYGDMDPRVWPEVIRPALADRRGEATFIGTPKGRNAFHDVYKDSLTGEDWFSLILKASETGIIAKDELKDAAKGMTDDQYAQEFECSFDAAVVGAYYSKEFAQADKDRRIGRVPYEPGIPVHTAWDLGIDDSTAIWFIQHAGREYRVLDYYEASGEGLEHYANVIRSKPYAWGDHFLPHDAEVKELGTGKSRVETLKSLGIQATVVPAQRVEDGINAVRQILPLCWFDEGKCGRGIEAMRQYRREFDDKTKAFRQRPLHDWTSHGADAFRTFAMGYRKKAATPWKQPEVKWVV